MHPCIKIEKSGDAADESDFPPNLKVSRAPPENQDKKTDDFPNSASPLQDCFAPPLRSVVRPAADTRPALACDNAREKEDDGIICCLYHSLAHRSEARKN